MVWSRAAGGISPAEERLANAVVDGVCSGRATAGGGGSYAALLL